MVKDQSSKSFVKSRRSNFKSLESPLLLTLRKLHSGRVKRQKMSSKCDA